MSKIDDLEDELYSTQKWVFALGIVIFIIIIAILLIFAVPIGKEWYGSLDDRGQGLVDGYISGIVSLFSLFLLYLLIKLMRM